MRKLLLVAVVLAISVGNAFCHPPKSIELKLSGATLEITIMHSVQEAAKHFIDDVYVEVNGKRLVSQEFTAQKDKQSQTAVYLLHTLVKGDKIKVTADCNKGGSLSRELSVP